MCSSMFVPNPYESFLENEVVAFSVHKHHQSSIVLDLYRAAKPNIVRLLFGSVHTDQELF